MGQIYVDQYFTYLNQMTERLANFATQAANSVLALYRFVFDAFMGPPREAWGILALSISVGCLGIFLNRRWVEAKPNEWLLVIRNGKLVRAGVGLKTFAGLLDTIVTFPSKVQRVPFSANNVTKEMQGIIIEGFAFWSVYRDEEGPFRCYKYLQGCNPSESVQALCESVLRNLIANSTIDEVMKNRNHLRNHMSNELKQQFKGWGIWLESVEITEVRISSSKLFEDLQAEFRQDTRLKAELIELDGTEKMTQNKVASDLKMSEKVELNESKRIQNNLAEELKRKVQEQAYVSKRNSFEIQRLVRERELEVQKIKNEKEKEVEKLKKDQSIQETQMNFSIEAMKSKIDTDKWHNETTLKKYKIDATARIYNTLNVKDVKINQFGDKSLLDLLPSLNQQ